MTVIFDLTDVLGIEFLTFNTVQVRRTMAAIRRSIRPTMSDPNGRPIKFETDEADCLIQAIFQNGQSRTPHESEHGFRTNFQLIANRLGSVLRKTLRLRVSV